MIIRVDVGASLHVSSDEGLQGVPVSVTHDLRDDLVGFPVLDPYNHAFPYSTATVQGSPFGLGHVFSSPTHVGLIDLDRTEKLLARFFGPGFPNPVQHEPGGRLRDAQVSVQLKAGHALEVGKAKVDGNGPFTEGDVGSGDSSSGANAEVAPAVRAPVRHRLCIGNFPGLQAPTLAAASLTVPKN